MAQILKTKSIYYNDVNLIAQPCKVRSRRDIPVELNRIIVSPMEAIVGKTFALKANELEFWLDGHNRIHERLRYKKSGSRWIKEILYP